MLTMDWTFDKGRNQSRPVGKTRHKKNTHVEPLERLVQSILQQLNLIRVFALI